MINISREINSIFFHNCRNNISEEIYGNFGFIPKNLVLVSIKMSVDSKIKGNIKSRINQLTINK